MRIIVGIMLVALVSGCGAPQADRNPFTDSELVITYKSEPPFVVTRSLGTDHGETGHSNPESGFDQTLRWSASDTSLTLTLISGGKAYRTKEFKTLSPSQVLVDEPNIRVEVKAAD